MGLHSVLVFSNDCLSCLDRPEFPRALRDALASGADEFSGLRAQHVAPLKQVAGVTVPSCHHHMDTVVLVIRGQQVAKPLIFLGRRLDGDNKQDAEEIVRRWAKSLGLTVTKKRPAKASKGASKPRKRARQRS